jgi:hypothetical protein
LIYSNAMVIATPMARATKGRHKGFEGKFWILFLLLSEFASMVSMHLRHFLNTRGLMKLMNFAQLGRSSKYVPKVVKHIITALHRPPLL